MLVNLHIIYLNFARPILRTVYLVSFRCYFITQLFRVTSSLFIQLTMYIYIVHSFLCLFPLFIQYFLIFFEIYLVDFQVVT